jgi:large subunit ribosomal protein L27
MSTHKAGGKAGQHVSPSGKRLGIKVTDGQKITPGEIIVRQRGLSIKNGAGVSVGRDYTLFAEKKGTVKFRNKLGKKVVSVL